ncbi:MAG: hypothetical protein IPK52_26765 [Chloroflexi bacterium]|nr:hypothetical protein [Chloroflexota bacterium]
MSPLLLAIFLAAHGLIHLAYVAPTPADPKYPFRLSESWILSRPGLSISGMRIIGAVLTAITVAGFVIAALCSAGIVVPQGWWMPSIALATTSSLAILILFWQPSLVLGVLIDAVLLIAVLGLHWQPWITG